ncbi:hypothetical protein [uncultured Erythrobacter sp.]|uniref:hypothetical protein n=1 Tax=uncultured Erythrobacter sp. TaxID=263913 RepID=UPI0026299EA2|nr:hypothetical protein [uncultured Erythrobacter sp.]
MSWLHIIAAGLIVFATIFHSLMGEKKLIAPTLAVDDPFIKDPMTQGITRFGWHSSSGFFLLSALIVVLPGTPAALVWATGALWLVLGLTNLIMMAAKHPGGYLLSLIGILILAGEAF